ncbi:hypothetical protein MMC25_000398 [Agyrium rufum]|nr:hypothetical protein [Agyrium rufum]
MSSVAERLPRSPFTGDLSHLGGPRHIPILPSSTISVTPSENEKMETTPPATANMGPPVNSSPETEEHTSNGTLTGESGTGSNGVATGGGLSAAAAANSQQCKVVQTAFIHKLYNMLEDRNIQNLISWSSSNDSFVMSPSSEFSKVLAQYFKHTNISSFVRQLNMYGFHKVSDVFHTGAPESTLWEFKHGGGNFKRGDLNGLREIKRRASRHALIHRDSFSTPHKPSVSQPGTPAEPMPDIGDPRITNLESNMYDLYTRLVRSEESVMALTTKCALLADSLVRCHQWSQEICHIIQGTIPVQESPVYKDAALIQKDIRKHLDMIRVMDDPHENLFTGRAPFFSSMANDSMQPISPRMAAQDERRPSFSGNLPTRASGFRAPIAHNTSSSPRRLGSLSGAPSINYNRSPIPPPPPPPSQHPLATAYEPSLHLGEAATGPNLGRRHTSHDIRATPGWQAQAVSPYESGSNSAHWPSSPNRTSTNSNTNNSDQHVRDMLASYEIGGSRNENNHSNNNSANPNNHTNHHYDRSQQHTPPITSDTSPSNLGVDSNAWQFGTSKFPPRLLDSAPQTRRSSMASNVHSLLNPAETAERGDEDDLMVGVDDRKRKRVQ